MKVLTGEDDSYSRVQTAQNCHHAHDCKIRVLNMDILGRYWRSNDVKHYSDEESSCRSSQAGLGLEIDVDTMSNFV